jgi:GLPGLI family protein
MRKYIYIYSIFCCCNFLFSQENKEFLTIKYKTFLIDETEDFSCFYYENNTLITNNKKSIYYETPRDTLLSSLSMGDLNNFDADYKYIYIKDFEKKVLLYDRNYGAKKIIIDSTNLITWKINDNTLNVLGYNCQEAIGSFRGRNYKAYFLKDIPYQNGPFKFDGLPGLILKIVSTDGCVNIEAYELEVSQNIPFPSIDNFEQKDKITWLEFTKFYKRRFDKVQNFVSEDGVTISIPKGYIEKFINE